jgi:superfamily I DNA and/or RNA helicase
MYFSPVVCSINDADHFINRDDGNMMNVAVSRAKDSFIVVGSKVGMSRVGGYTEKYVKYIEEEIYLKDVSEIT